MVGRAADERRPLRVLHIVGSLNRGGIETWLLHVLRHIDRSSLQMDFLVHTTEPSAYDDEVRRLGSRVIQCLSPSHPLRYARNFGHVLAEHGPYDVVHSHVQHFGGYVLRLAAEHGVPVRVAHGHTGAERAGIARRAYTALATRWIRQYATHGCAVSRSAGAALFGTGWGTDPRWRLLYCGLDLAPFSRSPASAVVRQELGIAEDAFVVGHVGRLVEQKNHDFLVDVAGELIASAPNVVVLLVGDGPLRSDVERKVNARGLEHVVRFLGSRPDVPQLMVSAFDVFVLPSCSEGLALAVVEAQAAGVPCVISDVVPEEAIVAGHLVRQLPLSDGPRAWAEAIVRARGDAPTRADRRPPSDVAEWPFNVQQSAAALRRLYESGAHD